MFEQKKYEPYGHFIFNTTTLNISKIDSKAEDNLLIDPVAFAYDFGARIYDARLGRFLSTDPSTSKFPGMSPYNSFNDNPVLYVDKNGREPDRNQAGTISEAVAQWKNLKNPSSWTIMKYIQTDPNAVRYVYTEKGGWIDLQHYWGAINYGKAAMDALEPASGNKFLQNHVLGKGSNESYYSYEDLPSNKFGSEAPIWKKEHVVVNRYGTTVESMKQGAELFSAVQKQFTDAKATEPEQAPNWRGIPFQDHTQLRNRLPDDCSDNNCEEIKTGDFIPQNHTSEPYNLKDFAPAASSINKGNTVVGNTGH